MITKTTAHRKVRIDGIECLTKKQAQERFGVGWHTMSKLVARGVVRQFHCGGIIFFYPVVDIEKALSVMSKRRRKPQYTHIAYVRTTQKQWRAVKEYARKHGANVCDVLERAIDDFASKVMKDGKR